MNPALEDTIYFPILTGNTGGVPTDADSTPTVSVVENGVAMGVSPTVTHAATGQYFAAIACTAANGFEAGKSYSAVASVVIGGTTYMGGIGNWQMRTQSPDTLPVASADAFLVRDWTLISGEATRSTLNALRFLRNGFVLSGSTLIVHKEDDSTAAFTRTVTVDPNADPVTGIG